MTILDLISGLKKTAATGGGEWAGACPFCGGRDRFRVWPYSGITGRYWCRSCGRSGDGLQLLRDVQGLTFREAVAAWGLSYDYRSSRIRCGSAPTWKPRPATTPGTTWADRAGAFLEKCERSLNGPFGMEGRAFLIGRGLTPETIEEGRLGWNMRDVFVDRRAWGLSPERLEDGRPRRLWIPAGLVIPCIERGRVIRLRVRRMEPGDGPRYVIVAGSGSAPLILGTGPAWAIVESELDGLLLAQEAGDLIGVVALGSAQARPDAATDQKLKAAGLILVSLDADQAGARESWGFWLKHYPNARRWPVPIKKDPGEAFQVGLSVRAWVLAGLSSVEISKGKAGKEIVRPGRNMEAEAGDVEGKRRSITFH